MKTIVSDDIGDYGQRVELDDSKITICSCTCMWGSLHPDAYALGETLCKHIKELFEKNGYKREEQKPTNQVCE